MGYDENKINKNLLLINTKTNKEKTFKKTKNLKIKVNTSYCELLKLNELWMDYIKGLSETISLPILLKADFHGCLLTVVSSKNVSLVGKTGIVYKETMNCFFMMDCSNNSFITPKKNTVFSFTCSFGTFTLYGTNFCVRPFDRVSKKFKQKYVYQ